MTTTAPPRMATSTLRLSEYAKKFTYPSGIRRTVWPRVEAKGLELGLGFDWWQSQLGTVCLGYGDDGRYVATIGGIGMSIPRQVGKTYFVLALLVILCILFPGLQVVWTAHHLRTSTKTFTSLRGICRRKKVAPHIRAMRSANGEQQVEFSNGSMIMFGARSQGFGRGFDEIDVEVFDEAQILDTKALEDMIAATNQARHKFGALLFFMGTPPRAADPAEAFRQRRDEAWAGDDDDSIWLELSADPASDPNDENQWPVMNPSYPLRTPHVSMLRLRKNLKDDDSWNREGRGIWDPKNTQRVIDDVTWAKLKDSLATSGGPVAYGIDVSPDRSRASIGMAGWTSDGRLLVEFVEGRNSADWVVSVAQKINAAQSPRCFVIDSVSPAAGFLDDLEASHVPAVSTNYREYASACGKFYDSAMSGLLTHLDQPTLNLSLSQASKRDIGAEGLWGWNRKKATSDITPLVAVTLAIHGLGVDMKIKKPSTLYAF